MRLSVSASIRFAESIPFSIHHSYFRNQHSHVFSPAAGPIIDILLSSRRNFATRAGQN
jgi:hypothetical protein